MINISLPNLFKGLLIGGLAAVVIGCTTVDPYTGQRRIDYGTTSGVAGAALGAAALGVAISNADDDDDDDDHHHHRYYNRDRDYYNRDRDYYNRDRDHRIYRPYRPYYRR